VKITVDKITLVAGFVLIVRFSSRVTILSLFAEACQLCYRPGQPAACHKLCPQSWCLIRSFVCPTENKEACIHNADALGCDAIQGFCPSCRSRAGESNCIASCGQLMTQSALFPDYSRNSVVSAVKLSQGCGLATCLVPV
jgi:hypothetical protein